MSDPDLDGGPLLEIHHLERVFPLTGTVAVRDISIEVQGGASIAILGRSGSGKSTLLNLIGLLDTPTSGEYLFERTPLTGISERAATQFRRDNVGFVFQSYHLIPSLSAAENVALGLAYRGVRRRAALERAEQLLHRVGLGAQSWELCRTMSGGEQQRVAVARALVAEPRLLLADEPTGNLDSDTGRRIIDLLLDVVQVDGMGLILVTHDEAVAARVGTTILMRDGEIQEVTGVRHSTGGRGLSIDAVSTRVSCDLDSRRQATMRWALSGLAAPFREAWIMLTSMRGHLWFTTSAVGVAVALVVASFGLSQSASAQVSSVFDTRRAREVHLSVDPTAPGVVQPQPAATPTVHSKLEGLRLDALANTAGVQHAGAFELWENIPISTLAVSSHGAVAMATPGALAASRAVVTWAKRSPDLADHEVILGARMAEALHVAQLDRAPEVIVDGQRRRVVGVLTRSIDPRLVGAAIVSAPVRAQRSTEAWVSVITRPGAADQVAKVAAVTLDPYSPDRLKAAAVLEPDELRGSLEDGVAVGMTALMIAALLAAIAGIGSMMLLSSSRRTVEFGLRRALGASRLHIAAQVATEAALAGAAGGGAGLVVGFSGILVVTITSHWRPVFDVHLASIALGCGVMIGIIAGVLPALFASRVDPAEALRG